MNKLIQIIIFLICTNSSAQVVDAISVKVEPAKIKFRQKDIHVDNDSVVQIKFENNFKEKYKISDFQYDKKPEVSTFWNRIKDWLAGILRNIFSSLDEEKSLNVVVRIIQIAVILIILFVVYLIIKAFLNKEGNWIFGKSNSKKLIDDYDLEKNLHLVDFEKLINKALIENKKRLTIRYYYLWLLKKMTTNGIIIWDIEKTNTDYLYEIKNSDFNNQFDYLSYLYNWIWYGEFDLDDDTFIKAKTAFEKAIKSLGNV